MEKHEVIEMVHLYDEAIRNKGLLLGELVEIKFSPRARHWLGQCESRVRRGEKHCTLKFATALLKLPKEEVRNTVVHEILHMLMGSHGHDDLWREGGKLVHHWWPEINITQVASVEVSREFSKALPKRKVYKIACTACECKTQLFRKNDVVRAVERGELRCPYCGGKLTVKEDREQW